MALFSEHSALYVASVVWCSPTAHCVRVCCFRSFRFKIKYEAFGHVWLDLTDDTRKVPICDGKITLKVLPMGELTAVPVLKKHGTFC